MMSRANPLDSLNLDDFQIKPAEEKKPKQDKEAIAKVAEENGFPSRQAQLKTSIERPRQHYFRTGRNMQMAIKGTLECHEHLQRLVQELDVPKGVILEEALKALDAIKSSPELIERLDREFPKRHQR
jgi:hypothetical protein